MYQRMVIVLTAVLLIGGAVASAGMVHQDWDTGVSGSRQAIIDFLVDLVNPVPTPDLEEIIDESLLPDASGKDNYVAKFYGWVTVPATGTYQFHYSCDDYGMLYVSQDEEMANAVEVAYVDGWAGVGEWDKYPSQHSAPMELKAGQTMAVMAFFQEAGGGDNMDIGWTGPGLSSDITNPTYLTDYITHIPPTPTKARGPVPEVGAVDVPRDTDLSWSPGKFAAKHDVYFGTNFDDVNDASRADSKGVLVSQGQTAETYDLGILEFGATYYWRIDEVNAPPTNTIYKGKIWEFTVEPFAYVVEGVVATSNGVSEPDSGVEKTVDGSGLNAAGQHGIEAWDMWLGLPAGADPVHIMYDLGQVHKLHAMVVWNYNVQFEMMLGFGLKDVTVEYSENGVDWAVLGDVVFNQATSSPDYEANTTVAFGGVPAQFVKLTVISNHGMLPQYGLSEVQFLQVPAQAREPQPADGDTGVAADATLSWRAGREAVSHEVMLGTDPNALVLVDTVDVASYTPGDLEFGMDYYWQINEVNEADEISVWEGLLWSFSTQEYALIDGFEDYTDDEGSRIYEAWVDGFGVNENGSQVGYLEAPFAEGSIVNSGSQSMPLFYENTGAAGVSEATKDLGGMNLTANGADSLRLFISGSAPAFLENADGTILMNAIGTDIWDAADEFRFAYKQLTGNGSMIARVDSLDNSPSGWAKAGVMIRQNDAVGSVHSFMPITGGDGNGASWQGRETANGSSVNTDQDAANPVAPPYWVRIDRSGDTLTGFISPDGDTWTQLGDARTIEMDDPVMIGLALTSHNANQATSAVFSNVSITGASGAWQIAEIGATQPEGNDPLPIYVALDNAVVVNPDAAATGRSGWTEWVIPLSEFGNVSNVKTMTVGVGNPNGGGSGSGLVFIDDIGFGRPAETE